MRKFLGIGVVGAGFSALFAMNMALADSLPASNPFNKYADPDNVVAAIQTAFDAVEGQSVRLVVYDSEETFLVRPAIKHRGKIDATGLAIVSLRGMAPGDYAFVAFLDEDGDGKLKRGTLGRPKEPLAFSNGVVPKLRKPRFDETKVHVVPGSVVVITLEE